ncbi:hypothetical protein BDB01DRAFT_715999 [Pilobolus umbonatus]|nr:hypothetical protein BDB01DRAFT_715999 [Pilobolus umbonatus]
MNNICTTPDNKTQVEYVYIDDKQQLRSKSKTLNFIPKDIKDIPPLYVPYYTLHQATESTRYRDDLQLKPVVMYADPFRQGNNKLVLCELYYTTNNPHPSNHRPHCVKIMNYYSHLEPWFGMEQEYILFDPSTGKPYEWPQHGQPEMHGRYYCGVGTNNIHGRDIMEAHYRACLFAGIKICGINAEVTPSQLEYQIGPCEGVKCGDELWMARYIMNRVAEDFGLTVNIHPRPLKGDWNPTGCHTNFSTNEMRSTDGLAAIDAAVDNMSYKHFEHIEVYGDDNHLRLTGEYETGHITVFSCGVGNRGASIRIPRSVAKQGSGYMEDRRPAGNINPYQVTSIIMESSFKYQEYPAFDFYSMF